MHGMINRAIQCFVRDTYGPQIWADIVSQTKTRIENFEAMLSYADPITLEYLGVSARALGKPVEVFLEDLGTYLVSHPNLEAIRRLLRFGGESFEEFLLSLNELEGRMYLALPELDAPYIEVSLEREGRYKLLCAAPLPSFGYALIGILRTMADDYGALVFIEHAGLKDSGEEVLTIHLLESAYADGRSFALAPDYEALF